MLRRDERTDPHITPTFDWIEVPEGHGRILVMNIYPGMPPYTETNGLVSTVVRKNHAETLNLVMTVNFVDG